MNGLNNRNRLPDALRLLLKSVISSAKSLAARARFKTFQLGGFLRHSEHRSIECWFSIGSWMRIACTKRRFGIKWVNDKYSESISHCKTVKFTLTLPAEFRAWSRCWSSTVLGRSGSRLRGRSTDGRHSQFGPDHHNTQSFSKSGQLDYTLNRHDFSVHNLTIVEFRPHGCRKMVDQTSVF